MQKRTFIEVQRQFVGEAYREIDSWKSFRKGERETWWGRLIADRQARRVIRQATGIPLKPLLSPFDLRGRVEAKKETRKLISDAQNVAQERIREMEVSASIAKGLTDTTDWIMGRYDAKAEAYSSVILGMTNSNQFSRLIGIPVRRLRKMNVVSVGEGTGELTKRVIKDPVGGKGTVKAIDISSGMLDEGRKRGNYVSSRETIVGSAEELPLKDRSVDVLIASYVIDTVKQPFKALQEFQRVLKDGGRLIIATPFPLRVESGSRRFVSFEDQIGNAQNPLQDMLALERELANLGFSVKRRRIGDFVDRDLGGPENWNCFVLVCDKLPVKREEVI